MELEIQARNFTLTPLLRVYIERRLRFALNTRSRLIQRISVTLSYHHGTQPDTDYRCRILITLPRLSEVIIEDTEANMYVAINRATERASRIVNRRITRRRDKIVRTIHKKYMSEEAHAPIDNNDAGFRRLINKKAY